MSSANTHGKTKAKPFHTKQDIIQQLFIQNRNVRFQVAHQKYKTNKKTSKHTKTKCAKHAKHDAKPGRWLAPEWRPIRATGHVSFCNRVRF